MSADEKNLIPKLDADLKEAMKTGDKIRLETLRSIRAALKEKEIALRAQKKEMTHDDVLSTILSAAKKRRESIEEFTKAGRADRADQERTELAIIQEYLPEQLSAEDIERKVRAVIGHTGATSMKDMGKVMSAVMQELKGKADGKEVQNIVKRLLGD